MKTRIAAAVAAIVIVGAGFMATPAFADTPAPVVSPPASQASLPPVSHPLTVPDSGGAQTNSLQPQGKTAPASDGVITGIVRNPGTNTGFAGVKATAVLYDDNGNVKFTSATTTAGDGSFTISGLAYADYWLVFSRPNDVGGTTVNWYGSRIDKPYGSTVTVDASNQAFVQWQLTPSAVVTGTISCEGCTSVPDPETSRVILTVPDLNKPNYWNGIALADSVDAQGNYIFEGLYPNDLQFQHYEVFIINDGGSADYAHASDSMPFALNGNSSAVINVIMRRLVQPIPGFDDQYGKVGNSVVNALYWDYLGRLPSLGEASGWVQLLYYGTPPSAVSDGFVNSDEYRLIRIDAAYQNILGRGADAPGRQGWLTNMKAGRITTDDIETQFYASQEYYVNHGGTNKSFAKALYTDLLHRSGSDSDYAFWGNLAAQHGRDWVIKQFWDEPETIGARVTAMYQKYLGRTPDAGGLQGWVNVALAIGDSGLRSGLTSSGEYIVRSQYRYSEQ